MFKSLMCLVIFVDTTKRQKINGIKLYKKKKHEIPQIDGNIFISEEKEVETQTDVFLTIDAKGAFTGPDLSDLYLEPP